MQNFGLKMQYSGVKNAKCWCKKSKYFGVKQAKFSVYKIDVKNHLSNLYKMWRTFV